MISKFIRERIEERYGHPLRYSKQADALAAHIFEVCKLTISASTLRRLLGFVNNKSVPRTYSLDVLAEYLGHKSWEDLLRSLEKGSVPSEKIIISLKPEQLKSGQLVVISYEPGKKVELRKTKNSFLVTFSNEKVLLLNDEVRFQQMELHYPLTFDQVVRAGKSIGRRQIATVSGITAIAKG